MTLPRVGAPKEVFFKGRPDDMRIGEWVKEIDSPPPASKKERIVIYGCPDDLGVTLNRGRSGAKDGPSSIRKHFYKMTLPMDLPWEEKIELYDLGDIQVSGDIKKNHTNAEEIARALSEQDCTLIALGGGHDYAAPNFLGWTSGLKKKKPGLINVDPHLDVRPLENGSPNSGTPFRVILDSKSISGKQFIEFGTRANRNARSHYEYCRSHKVQIEQWEDLPADTAGLTAAFKKSLKKLSLKHSPLAVTIDMDSCSEAEGMSAAPVLGFSAHQLAAFSRTAGFERRVRYLELAETAPSLEQAERSSRVAAEVLYAFLYARTCTLR